MASRIKGSVRRGQLVGTYGVGAIIALEDESFMVAGLDRWEVARPDIHEERLQKRLHVTGFVVPPAKDTGRDIPVVRFPNMYYCPTCRRLEKHKFFCGFNDNKCNQCGDRLVPSRFVVVCERGHIDEFPYYEWVHARKLAKADGTKHVLSLKSSGVSASLEDIVVECTCGYSETMKGSFGKDALSHIGRRCTGARPWLGDCEPCDRIPRTLQRGASNVFFTNTVSSLSIPPWSEAAFKILDRQWHVIRAIPESAVQATIEAMNLTNGAGFTSAELAEAVRQRKKAESGDAPTASDTGFREQEYEALTVGKSEGARSEDFVCVPADNVDASVERWFDQVMLVKRLREVRVLESFSRLLPLGPGDPEERKAPLSAAKLDWLPALEVQGEGVFLRMNETRLRVWESRAEVRQRAQKIVDNYAARFTAPRTPDRQVTPRLLLIHGLAHILIDQWSLECGYSAASLRERLYVSDKMAGLLIYTATSDAAGSLGGITAQADKGRLEGVLRGAVRRASWCSADPLCIESVATGMDSLNLAACHACLLLPETSCEESNTLLDRALLIGTPEDPTLGFFEEMLAED